MDDIYQKFIAKVRAEKTPEEAQKFFVDLMKFSAAELYFLIMTELTDEDMQVIDKMTDETAAQEEIKTRFKNRTGVTPQEFIVALRDKLSQEYLSPTN